MLFWVVRDGLRLPADHLSMPEGIAGPWQPDGLSENDAWWNWEEVAAAWEEITGEPTRFVVSFRRPDITGRSAVARRLVRSLSEHRKEWARAIAMLLEIPDAYWVSYDALIADPQGTVADLAEWIGVPFTEVKGIRNENAKWLPHLRRANGSEGSLVR
jgi:hypothetical protein